LNGMGDFGLPAVVDVITPLLYGATKAADDAVNSLVYSGFPSPPAPTPPPVVVNPQQSDLGQAAINASLASGAAANQAMYSQFFGQVADTTTAANQGLSIVLVVALVAGLFLFGRAIR
jgi:hypothetical protein